MDEVTFDIGKSRHHGWRHGENVTILVFQLLVQNDIQRTFNQLLTKIFFAQQKSREGRVNLYWEVITILSTKTIHENIN